MAQQNCKVGELMATKTIRTVLALDGEQEFRNKLKQINSNLGVMRTNMKALSDEYDRNGGKSQTLKERKSQLNQAVIQLREKMNVLNQAVEKSKTAYDDAVKSYEKAVQEHGKESVEAHKAAAAVTKAEGTYNNYRTQLINTENEMRNNRKEFNDLAKESDKLTKSIKLAGTALKEMGKLTAKGAFEGFKLSLEGVGKLAEESAKGLAAYTAAAGAAAAGIAKYSVGVGASFEEGMSGVKAIANVTDEEMADLTARAKELGSSSKFTATEVSSGFNYMAMAGWEAEDMLKGIDGVINLAAASGEDLGLVSDMVTDSLTAFKMEAGDAGRYADILAQASSNANTNVAMMGETFQYCAPIAGAMGYKVDDLAVAVGLMANAGIKGSMAGTSLRSVITNLSAPTDAAAAAMEQLGISLTNEDGSMKSFEETVQQLRNGFQGLSEAEKAAAAKAIAGKPGMSGLLALVNASDEDYQKLRESIDESSGAAQRMADIKLDNLSGDITILKSATEGLGLSIYETFSMNLRDGVKGLTNFINQIHTAVDEGGDLTKVFRDIGNQIKSQIPTAFKNIGPKIRTFLSGFNEVILQAVDIINESIPEITANVLPALTDGFTDLVLRLIQTLPSFVKNVAQAASKMFKGLFDGLKVAAKALTDVLPEILDTIFGDPQAISGFFDTGLQILMSLVKGITENADVIAHGLAEMLPNMIRSFANVIPDLVTAAVDIISVLIDTIDIGEVVNLAITIIDKLIEGLNRNMDKITDIIPDLVEKIITGIADNAGEIVKIAVALLTTLGTALVDSASKLVERIPEICEYIKNKFNETDWQAFGSEIMQSIISGFSTRVKDATDKLTDAVDTVEDSAFDYIKNKWESKGPLGFFSLAPTLEDVRANNPLNSQSTVNVEVHDVTITNGADSADMLVEMTQEAIRQKELAQGR